MTNSESYPFDKLRVNSIIIRCATPRWPPSIPYPDSKPQREALDCPARGPFIVLYVGARASLVENEKCFYSAFRQAGLNFSFLFIKVQAIRSILANSFTRIFI